MALALSAMLGCGTDPVAPAGSQDSGKTDAVLLDEVVVPDVKADAPSVQDTTQPDTPVEPECAAGEGCFLDPCGSNDDCQSGWCIDHLGDPLCSKLCINDCPPGFECKAVTGAGTDVTYICVSSATNLCRPCSSSLVDCGSPTGAEDVCVDYGPEGSFCGATCSDDDGCPFGFSCQDATTVEGVSLKQCVSDTGVCPCAKKSVELGLFTSCEVTNEHGACSGKRVCTDTGLSACDATAPQAETCNGADDNCDGDIDEGTCDDGNACTTDACNGEDGCAHTPVEGECLDGDSCTIGDHCEAGACVGTIIDCDDDDPCTDDACDALGGCVFSPNTSPCDDGDPCTLADQCGDGGCIGVAIQCDCQVDSDCADLEDGDLCNGTLACDTSALPYKCAVDEKTVVQCADDPGPCQASTCAPATGECGPTAADDGFGCDDGDPCTLAETCANGACTGGVALNCFDDNPCTSDTCDNDGCIHTANAAPCSDGDGCTLNDTCADGACKSGQALACDDGNACTDDACDPASGCVFTPNTVPCSDGDACTPEDTCAGGICQGGAPMICDDDEPCTTDGCVDGACNYAANTLPCADGDVCTVDDACADKTCLGAALVCDDDNSCTDDSCVAVIGCTYIPNTAPCSDGDACTTPDACLNGACKGGAAQVCTDDNPCTDDSCDAGSCVYTDNTAPCPGGQCTSGECIPDAPPCQEITYGNAGQGTNNGWKCSDVCSAQGEGAVPVDWDSVDEQLTYCHSIAGPDAQDIIKAPNNHSYPLYDKQNDKKMCKVNANGWKSTADWAGNGTPQYGDMILCRCKKTCPDPPAGETEDWLVWAELFDGGVYLWKPGGAKTQIGSCGQPWGVEYRAPDKVYVACVASDSIEEITLDGQQKQIHKGGTNGVNHRDVVFDNAGGLFFSSAAFQPSTVWKLNPDTKVATGYSKTGAQENMGIAFGVDGSLFWGDLKGDSQIWRTLAGGGQGTLLVDGVGPGFSMRDLELGPDGHLYVVSWGQTGGLRVFNQAGLQLSVTDLPGNGGGVAPAASGRVYALISGAQKGIWYLKDSNWTYLVPNGGTYGGIAVVPKPKP